MLAAAPCVTSSSAPCVTEPALSVPTTSRLLAGAKKAKGPLVVMSPMRPGTPTLLS
jgi:hypothetical protein